MGGLDQRDCGGRSYTALKQLFFEKGYLIMTPCAFTRDGAGILDGIEHYTEHAAQGVMRRDRGEGCQGSKDAVNRKTCQFDSVGGERKPIQDGLMNMWKSNRATHDAATSSEVRELISSLHGGARATPFQTKNWYVGSMVPTHADLVFHDTWPQRGLLVGSWLALEDVSIAAGPLVYYPGTHSENVWDFEGLNLTNASRTEPLHNPYQLYAGRLYDVIKARGLRPMQAILKRGEMLIWRGNLLHGGATVLDWNLTRKSLTTHYFVSAPGVRHWNPLASAAAGRWTKSKIAFIPQPRTQRNDAGPSGNASKVWTANSSQASHGKRTTSSDADYKGSDDRDVDGHAALGAA